MVDISNSYDTNAEPQGDFDPVPAGIYKAEIVESDVQPISKRENKGNALVLTWKIQGGDFDGRLIWQRLNMWGENMGPNTNKVVSIANSQFASVRKATGVENPIDTSELHHRPCVLSVTVKKDPNGQYADQNEIKSVKPLDGSVAPQSTPQVSAGQSQASQASAGGGRPWGNKPAA